MTYSRMTTMAALTVAALNGDRQRAIRRTAAIRRTITRHYPCVAVRLLARAGSRGGRPADQPENIDHLRVYPRAPLSHQHIVIVEREGHRTCLTTTYGKRRELFRRSVQQLRAGLRLRLRRPVWT